MILNPGDILQSPRGLLNQSDAQSSTVNWPGMALSGIESFLSLGQSIIMCSQRLKSLVAKRVCTSFTETMKGIEHNYTGTPRACEGDRHLPSGGTFCR